MIKVKRKLPKGAITTTCLRLSSLLRVPHDTIRGFPR